MGSMVIKPPCPHPPFKFLTIKLVHSTLLYCCLQRQNLFVSFLLTSCSVIRVDNFTNRLFQVMVDSQATIKQVWQLSYWEVN